MKVLTTVISLSHVKNQSADLLTDSVIPVRLLYTCAVQLCVGFGTAYFSDLFSSADITVDWTTVNIIALMNLSDSLSVPSPKERRAVHPFQEPTFGNLLLHSDFDITKWQNLSHMHTGGTGTFTEGKWNSLQ